MNENIQPNQQIFLKNASYYTPDGFKSGNILVENGKITEMKVHKTIPRNDKRCKVSYKQVPFEEGEIIYIKDCKREPKKIKVDDEWKIVPDTYEWWIKDYYKVVANEKKEVSDS